MPIPVDGFAVQFSFEDAGEILRIRPVNREFESSAQKGVLEIVDRRLQRQQPVASGDVGAVNKSFHQIVVLGWPSHQRFTGRF